MSFLDLSRYLNFFNHETLVIVSTIQYNAAASINCASAIVVQDAVAALCPDIRKELTTGRPLLNNILSLIGTQDIGELPTNFTVLLVGTKEAYSKSTADLLHAMSIVPENQMAMDDLLLTLANATNDDQSTTATAMDGTKLMFEANGAPAPLSTANTVVIGSTNQKIPVSKVILCKPQKQALIMIDDLAVPAKYQSMLSGAMGPSSSPGSVSPSPSSSAKSNMLPAVVASVVFVATSLLV